MKHIWAIYQERDDTEEDAEINSWTITNNPEHYGWDTDGGYGGYGLPKELAQWICDVLNKADQDCPYFNTGWGYWKENE